jgi:hypothetical protein
MALRDIFEKNETVGTQTLCLQLSYVARLTQKSDGK